MYNINNKIKKKTKTKNYKKKLGEISDEIPNKKKKKTITLYLVDSVRKQLSIGCVTQLYTACVEMFCDYSDFWRFDYKRKILII